MQEAAQAELPTNGNHLPILSEATAAAVKASVEFHQAHYQNVLVQRDQLARELAGAEERLKAVGSLVTVMESRVNSAVIARDDAVKRAAELSGLFKTLWAAMRVHEIEHGPIVRDRADDEVAAIGGA